MRGSYRVTFTVLIEATSLRSAETRTNQMLVEILSNDWMRRLEDHQITVETEPQRGPEEPPAFAEALRQARTERGLSKEELAQQMEVTAAAINKWENGAWPQTDNKKKLSAIFPELEEHWP
jgi:ribosome-binding protein aMBF1 (putative translation factor)